MLNEEKRKDEFDIARAIGVFLVILGHMPSVVPECIRIWIFSFHMPLFYFLAGVFSKDVKNVTELKNIINRKCKGLIVPYLFYCSVFLMADMINTCISTKWLVTELKLILLGMQGAQWFLYSVFIVAVLFSVSRLIKHPKLKIGFIGVCVLLGWLLNYRGIGNFFQIGSSLYAVGFYYWGFYKKEKIQYNLKKVIICFVMSVVGTGILSQWYSIGILDMKINYHIDVILNYIVALSGVYVIVYISAKISKNIISVILKHIGRNSVIYFALTWYIPGFFSKVFKSQSETLKILYYIIAFLISWICVKALRYIKINKLWNE